MFFVVVYFISPDFVLFEITSSDLPLKILAGNATFSSPANLGPMSEGCCVQLIEHVTTTMPTFIFFYNSDACDCLLEIGCLILTVLHVVCLQMVVHHL